VTGDLLVTTRRYLRARDAYLALLEVAVRQAQRGGGGVGIVDSQLIAAKELEEGYLAQVRRIVNTLDDPDTYHPGE
jgi:hypothetical protein